ncbi:MAG: OmpA family protein [Flavobacteriales bacterium]
MKKTIVILLFSVFTLGLKAQRVDSISIFFKSNEFRLSNENVKKVQHHLDSLKKYSWDTLYVKLNGFADVSASDGYNYSLSKKRIQAVRSLLKSDKLINSFSEKAYGEKGLHPENKDYNRRVDICFYGKGSRKGSLCATKEDDSLDVTNKKVEYNDSIINFPSGMQVVLHKNLVEMLQKRQAENFRFTDLSIGSGDEGDTLFTQDADGNPLISAGMFEMNVDFRGKDTCTDVVTIRVKRDRRCGSMLWNIDADGNWNIDTNIKVKGKVIGGIIYDEVTLSCGEAHGKGKLNFDCRTPSYEVLVKSRNIFYTLNYVTLSDKEKTVRFSSISVKNKKRWVRLVVPCSVEDYKLTYYEKNRITDKKKTTKNIDVKTLKKVNEKNCLVSHGDKKEDFKKTYKLIYRKK